MSLDDMRSTFRSTIHALHTRQNINVAELASILERIEAGGPAAEYNDEGEFLYYHEDVNAMRIDQTEFALRTVRNAFVVMLHHLWEKAVQTWRGAKPNDQYCADDAYYWLERKGIKLDREGLEFLRMACNAIKHNNRALWNKHKDGGLFAIPASDMGDADFATTLRLEDHHIEQLIDVLKQSGLHTSSTIDL